MLAELCRGAEDIDPILHSFKNDQQLRVGVRDLLGKEDMQATTGRLSDIAETCLAQIAAGRIPAAGRASSAGRGSPPDRAPANPAKWSILAMGKFGGREMNYHSDLDIVFLYEADGQTAFDFGQARGQGTSNQHFFSELGQRIIKTTSHLSAYGRLYEVDARLRPTGKSGSLAISLARVRPLFRRRRRAALGAAGAVQGAARSTARPRGLRAATAAVHRAAFGHRWRRKDAEEIRHMRARLEETAAGRRPEARAGRHRRYRVPRADAATAARAANIPACARPTRWRPWPSCTPPDC